MQRDGERLRVAAVEPDCCQVWSMLGRLYGNIHSLDIPGFDAPLDKALPYAKKSVQLDPGDQRARAILSYVRFLADELPAAREEAERALALNPSSLLFLDIIGYLLTLEGDWERGPRLIRKAMESNPYYKPVVHNALWLDLVRQGDDEAAYREALKLQRPAIYWDSLARAATLGLLGRGSEGGQALDELLRLRPDFRSAAAISSGCSSSSTRSPNAWSTACALPGCASPNLAVDSRVGTRPHRRARGLSIDHSFHFFIEISFLRLLVVTCGSECMEAGYLIIQLPPIESGV